MDNTCHFQIKVSIVVPCYNVEKYIDRCLDSLIHQSLKSIEIICVDDKSTDTTLGRLLEYAQQDSRIRVLQQAENSGAAVARNVGMQHAQGEYIGFVDADDYVDLDFYEKLYVTAIKTKASIVKANAKITDVDLTKRFDDLQMQRIRLYGKWRFLYQWWTGLYLAEMIKNNHIQFPHNIISGQDIVFLTKCIFHANRVALCNDTFYHYLRHSDSLDSVILSPEKIVSKIEAIKMIADFYNTIDISEKEYLYCYHQRWLLLISLIDRTPLPKCKKIIAQAFIDMFNACKNPMDLIALHLQYDATAQRYINNLKMSDTKGFLKSLASKHKIKFQENFEFVFLFLGFFPLMKISKKPKKLIMLLLLFRKE